MLSPLARAALLLAGSTVIAAASSVAIIYVADLLLPNFTARFDNYAFAFGIPLGVSPMLVYPLILINFRKEQMQVELERMVRTDPLTGLANRGAFFERASKAFGELRGPSTGPLALLMIDLDHFKRLNDLHGRATGDDMLKRVGGMIREAVTGGRESSPSLVARMGGEEFAVLLAGMDAVEASAVAERVCRSVRHAGIAVGGEFLTTTVSVGLAVRAPGEPLDATMRAADKAADEAKRAGRDRWTPAASRDIGPRAGSTKSVEAADVPLAPRQKTTQAA